MSTLPASITSLITAIETTSTRVALASNDGKQFLKIAKGGFWAFGADETEVEEASRWAINPNSFSTGFACWGEGELLDEAMALITDDPIIKAQLPTHDKPWQDQIGMQLVCLDGEDEGTEAVYSATSHGGKKAFRGLLDEVLAKAKAGDPEIVPIVELEVESYKHKKYGKVFTPAFNVVSWVSLDASVAPTTEPDDAVEGEPEPEPEPAKPARRRRRKAA